MGLVSFDDFLKAPHKNKALYLADTSFLINSLDRSSKEYYIRTRLSGKIGFGYNVVIKKELMHFLRLALFREEMIVKKTVKLHPRLYNLWQSNEHRDPLKELCNEGYAELFRLAFGEKGDLLKEYMETALGGCSYIEGKENKNAKNWDNVFAIMSMYGLDSADAMILNFAIGDSNFAGLITSDADFRVCGDVDKSANFNVVLPKAAQNRVAVKPWRPQN